jgi:hypothetical protein
VLAEQDLHILEERSMSRRVDQMVEMEDEEVI